MQPIKISILGDYLDCQLYRGRLYLWTFNGTLKIYKWNELVNSVIRNEIDKLPLKFCFLDGNYLYKTDLVELFHDKDFKSILLKKFNALSNQEFVITEKELEKFLYGEQETPSTLLPTDTEIYRSSLYYITEKGLFSTTAHRNNKKYPVSSKPNKLWDCNLLSIKANKYPQMALSGGNEGLYELDMSIEFSTRWNRKEPAQISKNHSSFANYTYWSIYNSSLIENAYMSLFDLHQVNREIDVEIYSEVSKPKFQREFHAEISEKSIFKSADDEKYLSWGLDDKIYRATNEGFEIVRFRNNPDLEMGQEYFTPVQNINLHSWKGKVIGGGTSYFGTIVECENALVVMLSNGDVETIVGPITRWRVYPRSMNYQNHLHIIKDDRLEIYSFNQDYFLDQDEKILGVEYRAPRKYYKSFV